MRNATTRTTRGAPVPALASVDGLDGMGQQVLNDLNRIGFDRPVDFMIKYPPPRIRQAIDLLWSKPANLVRNPAGFIRFIVRSPGAVPIPLTRKAQKYADMVCDGICRKCSHQGSTRMCERIQTDQGGKV